MSKKICNKALEYKERGWVVHPLSSPKSDSPGAGKIPFLKGWQKRKSSGSVENLKKFFLNDKGYNIGIQCGRRSNVTIIDFDSFTFKDILFKDIKINTLQSERTNDRCHVYFKYTSKLESSKHHQLGIEILSNGYQAVLPPSVHKSGQTYRWIDEDAPLQKFPPELIKRLNLLFEVESELKETLKKCRPYLNEIWNQKLDIHNEKVVLACAAELKTNGADLGQFHLFCRTLLGKHYSMSHTSKKWNKYVKETPWTYEEMTKSFPTHISKFIVYETVHADEPSRRVNNPQDIDHKIASRAAYFKSKYYFKEDIDSNIIIKDKETHREVWRLVYDKDDTKYYDKNYMKKEGNKVAVNEHNSAYYAAYLESLKQDGVPLDDWDYPTGFCSTRIYKRMVHNPLTKGWAVELYYVCRTLNEKNEWVFCDDEGYIPIFTLLEPKVKHRKLRSLYKKGFPIKKLTILFGYKHDRAVRRLTEDLRDEHNKKRKLQKQQFEQRQACMIKEKKSTIKSPRKHIEGKYLPKKKKEALN